MRFFLPLTALLVSFSAWGEENIRAFAKRLAARGQKISTLQASFIQRKRIHLFQSEITTKGRIIYQRPDKLRWETLPPDRSLLVVVGKHAELRLEGERPKILDLQKNRSVGLLIEQLLVWVGGRPIKNFEGWHKPKIVKKRGETRIYMNPRGKKLQKYVTSLEIIFDSDLNIRQMQIKQKEGDRTDIVFSEIMLNKQLTAKCFQ